MKIIAIIPSRYESTRLPGKPLADICGKPMIQHVYEQVKKSKYIDYLCVATDDQRIKEVVKGFNGNVIMTSKIHKTGTDRITEAIKSMDNISDNDLIINVQGDEPFFDPVFINKLIEPLIKDPSIVMSTLATKTDNKEQIESINTAKVVFDKNHNALYFSRSKIPFFKNKGQIYLHIGAYCFRKKFLLKFAFMDQTPLEISESLEHLRALENGFKIKIVEVNHAFLSVDTEDDLKKARELMQNK